MNKKNILILITLFYVGAGLIASLFSNNVEFLFYIAVVLLIGFLLLYLHKRYSLKIETLYLASIWGLLHIVGGLVPLPNGWPYNGDIQVFYSLWIIPNYLKYDHIVHAFGFGVTTIICWQLLTPALKNKRSRFSILFLCILSGMGLGALNEIIEFMAVLLIPDTNVGGYMNTGWDLVANLVGTSIAALYIFMTDSE